LLRRDSSHPAAAAAAAAARVAQEVQQAYKHGHQHNAQHPEKFTHLIISPSRPSCHPSLQQQQKNSSSKTAVRGSQSLANCKQVLHSHRYLQQVIARCYIARCYKILQSPQQRIKTPKCCWQ
jgi:hypothetical protein